MIRSTGKLLHYRVGQNIDEKKKKVLSGEVTGGEGGMLNVYFIT